MFLKNIYNIFFKKTTTQQQQKATAKKKTSRVIKKYPFKYLNRPTASLHIINIKKQTNIKHNFQDFM